MLLLATFGAYGQHSMPQEWMDYIDQYGESVPDEMYDEIEGVYLRFADNPININDTSSASLSNLFFITPFQLAALRAYIQQTGPILSLNELSLVKGFDSTTVAMLKPIIIFGHTTESHGWKNVPDVIAVH